MSNERATEATGPDMQDGSHGIRGWLIPIGIGIALAPLSLGFQLWRLVQAIFLGDAWERLTDPTSPGYHWLWAPVLRFELCAGAVFVGLAIVVAVLFFRKSPRFPLTAVCLWTLQAVVVGAQWILIRQIPAVAAFEAPLAPIELALQVGSRALFVAYVLRSKRVRNTFRAG